MIDFLLDTDTCIYLIRRQPALALAQQGRLPQPVGAGRSARIALLRREKYFRNATKGEISFGRRLKDPVTPRPRSTIGSNRPWPFPRQTASPPHERAETRRAPEAALRQNLQVTAGASSDIPGGALFAGGG